MEKENYSNTDIMLVLANITDIVCNIEDKISEIITAQNNDTGLIEKNIYEKSRRL